MTATPLKLPRVAWLAIQPAPYVLPLFDALERSGKLDLHVFFSRVEAQQPWLTDDYERFITPASRGRVIAMRYGNLSPGIVRALWREPWDVVVISGYSIPTMQAAIVICAMRRIPFVIQGDVTLLYPRRPVTRALKRALLYPLLRQCGAAIALGIETRRFWQHEVGISAERALIVPFTPHLDLFRTEAVRLAPRRTELRKKLCVPEQSVVGICVGRLIPEKSLDLLLAALARVAPHLRPHLLLVGEGPERAKLEGMVAADSLPVQFLGFRQNHELPALYAAADFFVLSSHRDKWGVVVAEAAAARLPMVLSDQVGAAYDLLEDGRNGFLVPSGSLDAWRRALERCVAERDNLGRMGEQSCSLVSGWTCAFSTRQALKAVEIALRTKHRRFADIRLVDDHEAVAAAAS